MSTKKKIGQFTDDDVVESFVVPGKLNAKQKEVAKFQLQVAREKSQAEITPNDRLILKLMQLKFQIEDYLNNNNFNPKFTFGYFLREYVGVLGKKRKIFAREIDIDETELSQLINRHRFPNDNIIVRLEIHSNNSISAVTWFKLVEREKEHTLRTNKALRQRERAFVTNKLSVKIG